MVTGDYIIVVSRFDPELCESVPARRKGIAARGSAAAARRMLSGKVAPIDWRETAQRPCRPLLLVSGNKNRDSCIASMPAGGAARVRISAEGGLVRR